MLFVHLPSLLPRFLRLNPASYMDFSGFPSQTELALWHSHSWRRYHCVRRCLQRRNKRRFCTPSPVSSPFEVSSHVLLFMQSEAAGTTSAALCDPHSADLKEADHCQVYQRAKVQPGGAARTCNGSTEAAPPLRSWKWDLKSACFLIYILHLIHRRTSQVIQSGPVWKVRCV